MLIVENRRLYRGISNPMSVCILGLEEAERTEPARIDLDLSSPLHLTPASFGT